MSESFRQLLRALPDFPEVLPDFDPAAAPADPAELFRLWLDEALAAGVPQPNACSRPPPMSTAGRRRGC